MKILWEDLSWGWEGLDAEKTWWGAGRTWEDCNSATVHKVVFKIALNMVEEFDGKKGDEKYDEDFLQQYIGKFLDQKSAWGTSDEIFNHCIKNFFKKLNPDDTRTRSTRKRRVPGGPVMTYSTTALRYSLCKLFILYLYLYLLKSWESDPQLIRIYTLKKKHLMEMVGRFIFYIMLNSYTQKKYLNSPTFSIFPS